jgi:hypothetical protein
VDCTWVEDCYFQVVIIWAHRQITPTIIHRYYKSSSHKMNCTDSSSSWLSLHVPFMKYMAHPEGKSVLLVQFTVYSLLFDKGIVF